MRGDETGRVEDLFPGAISTVARGRRQQATGVASGPVQSELGRQTREGEMRWVVEDILECVKTRRSPPRLQVYAQAMGPEAFWRVCQNLASDWGRWTLMGVPRCNRYLRLDPEWPWCRNLELFWKQCPELRELVVLTSTQCDFVPQMTEEEMRELNDYCARNLPRYPLHDL